MCIFVWQIGDIFIFLETFERRHSFLSAPFEMMLLRFGRWQLYQLCIRWECVEGFYANQVHPDGWQWNKWKCSFSKWWVQVSRGSWKLCEQPQRRKRYRSLEPTIFESADTQNCHFERHSIHETRPKYVCSPTRLIKRMSHLVEYNRVRRKMMFNLQAAIYSLMFILQIWKWYTGAPLHSQPCVVCTHKRAVWVEAVRVSRGTGS